MTTKALTKSSADVSYSPAQIELIKNTVAVGATDNELGLFLQVCKNRKLDPFSRQIHFVKRAGKGTIQTGIDGFRTIAERTGHYAGNDDPVFDNETNPKHATVTVWKMVNGVRCPFTATARWSQYCPGAGQDFMWKKMPHVMLGKCAEALALRKAFPEALSGLYSDEEMEQSGKPEMVKADVVSTEAPVDVPPAVIPEVVKPAADDLKKPATAEQVREIAALCKELGGTVQALYEKLKIKGRPTRKQAMDMIDAMSKKTGRVTEADVAVAEELAKAA